MSTSLTVKINKNLINLTKLKTTDVSKILGFDVTQQVDENGFSIERNTSLIEHGGEFHKAVDRLRKYALKHTIEVGDVDNEFNDAVIKIRERFEKNCYSDKNKDIILSFL